MGTRSPHKNFSLEKLLSIKADNYYDESTDKDYDRNEVDQLIWLKQGEEIAKLQAQRQKDLLDMEKTQDKILGVKRCSKCKWKLPFKYFSPQSSNKFFKLRSQCKDCRNKVLKRNLTVVQYCSILVA